MAYIQNDYASVRRLGIYDSVDIAPSTSALSIQNTSLYEIINAFLYKSFSGKIMLYNWILKEDFIFYRLLFVISPKMSTTTAYPEIPFNKFLEAINNDPPEPYFAWIHLLPPHDPYLPAEPFMGIYNSSSELRTDKSQRTGIVHSTKYSDENKPFPQDIQKVADILHDRYDEFIRYCDDKFKDFIVQLQKKKMLKNTVIILSSDHGEIFEHDFITHGGPHLYEELTHIPLIIREPQQSAGKIIDERVEQIDITATILDLVDIPVPSWMEGYSLKPLMHDEKLPPRALFSMSLYDNPRNQKISKGTIAVWEGDYKLVHYLDKNNSLLFNLKRDPGELNNLYDIELETGRRMLTLIKDNLRKANEKIKE
jgi:arylsulfatase A-like enzyme